MAKTYYEYEVDEIAKAKKRGDDYAAQRKAQADTAVKTSDGVYDAAIATAEKNYNAAAKETESGYREMYDANAVQELVARRNVAEAMANMNLTDSGLNRTQQTAISLQRGRADMETTRQKQAAVDAIMRELDNYRTQNTAEKAAASHNIYAQADADILGYRNNEEALARQNAASLYAADQERAAAQYAADKEYAAQMAASGYVYNEAAGGYVKAPQTAAGLTDAQIKIAVDYANENGISYADAAKEIFGVTVSGNDPYGGYSSLNEAAEDYYINGKRSTNSKGLAWAKTQICPPERWNRGNGDYRKYAEGRLDSMLANGDITPDESMELAFMYGVVTKEQYDRYFSGGVR